MPYTRLISKITKFNITFFKPVIKVETLSIWPWFQWSRHKIFDLSNVIYNIILYFGDPTQISRRVLQFIREAYFYRRRNGPLDFFTLFRSFVGSCRRYPCVMRIFDDPFYFVSSLSFEIFLLLCHRKFVYKLIMVWVVMWMTKYGDVFDVFF